MDGGDRLDRIDRTDGIDGESAVNGVNRVNAVIMVPAGKFVSQLPAEGSGRLAGNPVVIDWAGSQDFG